MQISYNWLKQFIKLDTTPEETAEILTDLGLEVEGIEAFESLKGGLKGVVVGHVISCEQHPNADKLSVTRVDLGNGEPPVQIVCGAPNVAAGQKVPVATIGTVLYDKEGNEFVIKKGKIRGEESHGMICAEDELGLGESHDGILVLDNDLEPGTKASEVFDIYTDAVLEIGLTPNRADAMSHWGVARDLRAGLIQQKPTQSYSELITPSVSKFKVEKRTLKYDIQVEDTKLAPRYCGVTISGITVKPSPAWLQNALKAIGITPKNNIVDATNYVLHELGQPLHAFDASRIKGNKIIVKNAVAGSKFITLDGVERTLHEEDIVICDENQPLCLAGVLGGQQSGVSENTTAIFLESAYFNSVSIRKTAKRHGISTDASFRFERGIDPNITDYALKHAAILITEISGGEITSDVTDLYPKKIEDFSVFLNYSQVNKILGEVIPQETIKKILASLDIKINNITDKGLGMAVPAYRVDVQREIDVIEEILRVYGFNNIKTGSKINATIANGSKTDDHKVQNITANQLVSQGFYEIMANSLTSPAYSDLISDLNKAQQVQILNPLSSDLAAMRQTLLFGGLESMAYNINRKNTDLKYFEFGKTYAKTLSGYEEYKHLALFATGNASQINWNNKAAAVDFFLFKGYIDALLQRLGINKLVSMPNESDQFSEGLVYFLGDRKIVSFGSLKKSILKHFDIKQEMFFADFNWNAILSVVSSKIKFAEISKYPIVKRDLALLLKNDITFAEVYKTVKLVDKNLISDVSLFDVYEGDKLPEGTKSYAISIKLQDKEKTLTDVQIDKIMSKIQKQLQTEVGAELR
ncbi:phenylalanine--tRNA ligase subunit beta [Flavobacterium sp. xlx-214]|uniref:phenylalanine--tRNA ligase subunit beta n=1 Tax=unclassified Flavobacterium TaxID=196869 RepID=UPI0013D5EA56|nr:MULTISPECIES: phenylalanine--tRNA ligase subunit beta [unclassified Flavobacterium]MBA5791406.1 phenylalanine--tRNA ligase subunit beta [Flavobacterium sp. xlx-221]QMI83442.1 phenylalanine--tRNA ligase subunit beta [Flavobacterium sp. xlx-214]